MQMDFPQISSCVRCVESIKIKIGSTVEYAIIAFLALIITVTLLKLNKLWGMFQLVW